MIMIIDGNNLSHRAYHKFAQFTNRKGESTAIIYGGPYMVGAALKKFPPKKLYVAFDASRSKERLAILPFYKERDKKIGFDHENFQKQMDIFKTLLLNLGVSVLYEAGEEADDLIYRTCKAYKKEHKTIISSDKDFVPLLDGYTKIWNPSKDTLITKLNAKEVYGFAPHEFVDYLCLLGDKSDNIPGVSGLGDKRIRDFLDKWNSIDEFLEALYNQENVGPWDKYADAIEEVYERNFPLINLRYFHNKYKRDKVGLPNVEVPTFDLEKVMQIARINAITTFAKPEFIKPFRRLIE